MNISKGAGPPITLVFAGVPEEILLSIPELMWLLTSLKPLAQFDTALCFTASLRCDVTLMSCRPRSLKLRHLRLLGSRDTAFHHQRSHVCHFSV